MGAPPLCGGGPPYELGPKASVLPAAKPFGAVRQPCAFAHSPVLPGAGQKSVSQSNCLAIANHFVGKLGLNHFYPHSPSLCRRGGAGGEVSENKQGHFHFDFFSTINSRFANTAAPVAQHAVEVAVLRFARNDITSLETLSQNPTTTCQATLTCTTTFLGCPPTGDWILALKPTWGSPRSAIQTDLI